MPQRLRSILRGWRLAQTIGTVADVLYICAPGVERTVIREVEAVWFEQGIQVARMPTLDDLIRRAAV